MTYMTKTRSVLHHESASAFYAYFASPKDHHRRHRLALDRGIWEDMARPDTITVTIEHGDQLNPPADDTDPATAHPTDPNRTR